MMSVKARITRSLTLSIGILGAFGLASEAEATRVWAVQEPLSYVSTTAGGYAKTNLVAGRGSDPGDPWFHQIVRKCLGDTSASGPGACNGKRAAGLYTYFDPDSMAWVTPEEFLPTGDRGNDFNLVVTPDDEVLVVHEYWDESVGDRGIALSRRNGGSWTQEWISDTSGGAGAATPQVFLQEFPDSVVLHVTYEQGPVEPTPLIYRRKRVSGTGGTWSAPDTVSTYLGGGALLVDSIERPHHITKYLNTSGSPHWVELRHVHREPTGWVDALIDTFAVTAPPPLGAEYDVDSAISAGGTSDDEFYLAYSSPLDSSYARSNGEIWVTRLTVTPADSSFAWATAVQASPDENERAVAGRIDPTLDGFFHLTYMRPPPPGQIRRPTTSEYAGIFYRRSSTPLVSSSWTDAMDITADRATAARSVGFARYGARTMFTYSLFAQADPDDWWQPWYRFFDTVDTLSANTRFHADLIELHSDFLVAPTCTLAIAAGSQVLASSPATGINIGNQSGLVELVVDGVLEVEGTEADPVVLTSESATSGSWGGILFRDAADDGRSSIEYAEIEYPTFGIQVDSLACTLIRPKFESASSAEIYVDRDTRIPEYHEWDLLAPTRVVIDPVDHSGANHGGEDADHIEITVDGVLRTGRPTSAAATDSVWFQSGATSPASGDWVGITVRWDPDSTKGVIRDASIGWCVDPLSFVVSDSALVEDSNLHHFGGTGIFDWGTGGFYRRNLVQGSQGVSQAVDGGSIGIHSLTSMPTIEENTVLWHKQFGVKLEWSKTYCTNLETDPYAVEDSVFVSGNMVTGAGGDDPDFLGVGVSVVWGCRMRHLRLYGNDVVDWWFDKGVSVFQCSDTRLQCNRIEANGWGFTHSRNVSETTGGSVRLQRNFVNESRLAGVWADDLSKLVLYDGGTFATSNEIRIRSDSTGHYVDNQDTSTSAVLDARHTVWRVGSAIVAEGDSLAVRMRITGTDSLLVNIADFETVAADCSGSQQASANRPRQEIVAAEQEEGPPLLPSCSVSTDRERTTVSLESPAPGFESLSVRVFDVLGRRVTTVHDGPLPEGRHELVWNHDLGEGRRVSSGIYFLVIRTAGWSATQKLLVVR
ncbi:MAG: hypothetical protein R3B81_08685 [bacterium]